MVPYNNIGDLLEKYWRAETSLDEEKLLKQYFAQSNVDPKFQQEKALFNFFDLEQDIEMPSDIDLPEAKVISIVPQRSGYRRWMGVAASIAVLAALVFTIKPLQKFQSGNKASIVIEHEDPEEALEDLKVALAYISGKMNQSISSANIGLEKVNEVSKLINGETL